MPTVAFASPNLVRLGGDTRYDTSDIIASTGFSSADTVVIASGEDFPDALSASALAGSFDCPVLLTQNDRLTESTKQRIQNLGAKKAYILGGTSAITEAVENAIKQVVTETERIGGSTRQETATRVLNEVKEKKGAIDTVIVACSDKPYDALSVGPYAFKKQSPIVLANSAGKLDESTLSAIKASGAGRVIIVGGEAAIKNEVKDQISSIGITSCDRWWGTDRYDTSQKIVTHAKDEGMSYRTIAVASGENFPDTLSGAALVGHNNGAIILVTPFGQAEDGFIHDSMRTQINTCYLLGETSALSTTAESRIRVALDLSDYVTSKYSVSVQKISSGYSTAHVYKYGNEIKSFEVWCGSNTFTGNFQVEHTAYALDKWDSSLTSGTDGDPKPINGDWVCYYALWQLDADDPSRDHQGCDQGHHTNYYDEGQGFHFGEEGGSKGCILITNMENADWFYNLMKMNCGTSVTIY